LPTTGPHTADAGERLPRPLDRADMNVGLIVVSLAAASVAIFLVLPDPRQPTIDISWVGVAAIVVALGLSELPTFKVVLRESGIWFPLSEIPLALALAFVSPALAASVRAAFAAPVLVATRQHRGLKLAHNLALSTFEVMFSYALFRTIIAVWGDQETVVVLGATATLMLASVVTSVFISMAISVHEGHLLADVTSQIAATWWFCPVASVLGGMTLGLALIRPSLALLAILPAAGIWYALNRFGAENQALRDLTAVHGLAGRIGRTLDVDEICEITVDELFESFDATGVAVCRFVGRPTDVHRRGAVDIDLPESNTDERWIHHLAGSSTTLLSHDDLRESGLVTTATGGPVIVTPLIDAGQLVGALVVLTRWPVGQDVGDGDKVRLDGIAEQLSVSLRRGMVHERLEYEARHDALTDLPARILFERAVTDALARPGDDSIAVMMLDLDRFKEVNDTLGHHAGDALLVEFGRRMSALLKPDDMLARLAGDEFAILCRRPDADTIVDVARSCVDAGGRPVVLDGLEIVVTVSVGVALANPNETDALQPMRRADIAMYNAKWQRTGVEVYRDEIDRRTPARLSMLGDLRSAIEGDEITVVYQPKLDLHTREVTGVEALVRWNSTTRGVVAPSEFVRVAEDIGLIKNLTDLVLEHGIAGLRRFHDLGLDLRLAVNLSTHDLFDTGLPDRVMSRLARHEMSASAITLEITESSLLVDAPRTRATIDDLHHAGFHLAVDDFGTGYSSLSYLRRLPVHELKIDQSFVSGMLDDPQDEVIVKSTIDLGHNLQLSVVAEGVEDDETLHALAAMGCDVAQGFGIARPLAEPDLIEWVGRARRQRRRARDEATRSLDD
jgi:diguanylate cyclase (GGDEF)-like protein